MGKTSSVSFSNDWWNCPVEYAGLGLSLWHGFLSTNSISLIDTMQGSSYDLSIMLVKHLLCVWVSVCRSVYLYVCMLPTCVYYLQRPEGCQNTLNLELQLWATVWVLGIEPGVSTRAASALNCWATSPVFNLLILVCTVVVHVCHCPHFLSVVKLLLIAVTVLLPVGRHQCPSLS